MWGCCDALGFGCVQVFNEPALKKAKASVAKSGRFTKREPMWIQK